MISQNLVTSVYRSSMVTPASDSEIAAYRSVRTTVDNTTASGEPGTVAFTRTYTVVASQSNSDTVDLSAEAQAALKQATTTSGSDGNLAASVTRSTASIVGRNPDYATSTVSDMGWSDNGQSGQILVEEGLSFSTDLKLIPFAGEADTASTSTAKVAAESQTASLDLGAATPTSTPSHDAADAMAQAALIMLASRSHTSDDDNNLVNDMVAGAPLVPRTIQSG